MEQDLADLYELEALLSMQESYFENLIKLGLIFENSGHHQKAFETYKKGIEKAEKAKNNLTCTIMGLLE